MTLLARADELAQWFHVGSHHVDRIARHFVAKMNAGLGQPDSAIQLPSHVTSLPSGSEQGLFLAVDLGGTNCRVCSVSLLGNSKYTTAQTRRVIPRHLRVNTSHRPLFASIAAQVQALLQEHHPYALQDKEALRLGFSFSFTYENESLTRGRMVQWDKGWDIADALGRDPCEMLQTALDDLDLPVRVAALASDSIGTLMARSYASPRPRSSSQLDSPTLMSAIFGTGTNAAYVERLHNIRRLRPDMSSSDESKDGDIMLVNTEWGAWDDELAVLRQNELDVALDTDSANPGQQLFEKMVSGLYLGELFRLAVQKLRHERLLTLSESDCQPNSQLLDIPYAIDSSILSGLAAAEKDLPRAMAKGTISLDSSGTTTPASEDDLKALCALSSAIVRRAARLAGAAMGAIIIHSGRLSTLPSSDSANGPPTSTAVAKSLNRPSNTTWDIHMGGLSLASLSRRLLARLRALTESVPRRTAKEDDGSENRGGCVVDVGVDGSLFEFHPTFERDLREALRSIDQIGAHESSITMGLTKDGSGVGAALVAQSVA